MPGVYEVKLKEYVVCPFCPKSIISANFCVSSGAIMIRLTVDDEGPVTLITGLSLTE